MKSTIKAYAKINLFLDITGRLENGYHTLNTVMQQIDLHDVVTVEVLEGNDIFIECSNPDVPCNEKNIAYKAASAFMKRIKKSAEIHISIQKNIPLEAGMGGSSTDGAAVLKALNEIYGNLFTTEELCIIGEKLGADVPFCIVGGTAVCKGIGEIITPIHCNKDYAIAVIKPDFSCSTATAYGIYDNKNIPENPDFETFIDSLSQGAKNWPEMMYNVFEILYEDIRITEITSCFKNNGADGSILTGSGSAVFSVFRNKENAESALSIIDAPFKKIVNPL